jgi:hypothetical protein
VHGCGNDPLRDFYNYHFYSLFVQPVVVALRHCVLLRVLRLVGVARSYFFIELPTRSR